MGASLGDLEPRTTSQRGAVVNWLGLQRAGVKESEGRLEEAQLTRPSVGGSLRNKVIGVLTACGLELNLSRDLRREVWAWSSESRKC